MVASVKSLFWNEFDLQLFEKLKTKPIKGEDKYMHGKLNIWKKRIKTNFYDEEVPYDMNCKATADLEVEHVYKQDKNFHTQGYVGVA